MKTDTMSAVRRLFPLFFVLALAGCYQPATPWTVEALAISPDGERLAVVWKGGSRKSPAPAVAILYDLRGEAPSEEGRYDGWQKVQSLAYSPSGDRLVVAANARGQRDLFLWRPGEPPSPLTSDKAPEGDPLFTGDGLGLVYRVKEGAGFALVWRRVDGTDQRHLTSDTTWRWEPLLWAGIGGDLILHQMRRGKELGISAVPLEGGRPTRILDEEGVEEALVASGGHLIFRREGAWVLCEGEDVTRMKCREKTPPEAGRWSGRLFLGPDGLPGGIVAGEEGREALFLQAGGGWRVEPPGGVEEVVMVASAGHRVALALEELGHDAFIEIVSWRGKDRVRIFPPGPDV